MTASVAPSSEVRASTVSVLMTVASCKARLWISFQWSNVHTKFSENAGGATVITHTPFLYGREVRGLNIYLKEIAYACAD